MADEREPPKVARLPLGEDARARIKEQRKQQLKATRPKWAAKLGAVGSSTSSAGLLGIPRPMYLGAAIVCAINAWRHEGRSDHDLLAAGVLLALSLL